MRPNPARRLAAAALVLAASPAAARAQAPADVRAEAFAGSELEEYLRVLQVAGKAPLYPWSQRGFSPAEVERVLPAGPTHPWAARYDLGRDSSRAARLRLVRPAARLVANTAEPYGENDGPVWAGRGLTGSVQAGFQARVGGLSLTVAPVAFLAQNASFGLLPTGYAEAPFADPLYAKEIDQPQRFGDGAYGRVDPGETTLRLDLGPAALEASTASQVWGPGSHYPLVLGNNAGGFPHVSAGTSRPLNVGIGRIHGRVVYGALQQSGYSPLPSDSARRFMAGAVATFLPRGLPGLEVGGTRFFHALWTTTSRLPFGLPFGGLLKARLAGQSGGAAGNDFYNQIASLFARWVVPAAGVEVWGEYAREDHSYDLRDFTVEPDHSAGYSLGFRKVWTRGDGHLVSLRLETVDTRISDLEKLRGETTFYVHGERRQGHTQYGQVLGSPAAFGGGGATVAVDAYGPGGRWSFAWSREGLGQGTNLDRQVLDFGERHSLSAERLFFRGPAELSAGVTGSYELGRQGRRDRFNLNAALGARFAL